MNMADTGVLTAIRVERGCYDRFRRFVCLCSARASLLADRHPVPCEVLNDVDGSLVLLSRYWRQHRDALLAELDSGGVVSQTHESELDRVLAYYHSEVQSFPGLTPKAKLEAFFARMRRVYVENHPPTELVRFFDSPETLFYVDCKPDSSERLFLKIALSKSKGRAFFSEENSLVYNNETSFSLPGRKIEAA